MMPSDQIVTLVRATLEEVAVLTLPVLAVVVGISLLINIFQVLTSLQDMTVSTVARLMATGGALFLFMPWMWRHVTAFTLSMFSNFNVYLK